MSKIDRLGEDTSWIDLEFVERERTLEPIIEIGIRLHLAGLSLSNTKQALDRLGVSRSRTAIHNWIRKAELQPTSDVGPNQVAVDETVIRVNDERRWLYAVTRTPVAMQAGAFEVVLPAVSTRRTRTPSS